MRLTIYLKSGVSFHCRFTESALVYRTASALKDAVGRALSGEDSVVDLSADSVGGSVLASTVAAWLIE